jgi:hypothetical protein
MNRVNKSERGLGRRFRRSKLYIGLALLLVVFVALYLRSHGVWK